MGVPSRKTSKARRDKRRSHDYIEKPNYINCPDCGETMMPHHACPSCGKYKGKQVIEIVEKTKQ